MTCVVYVMEHDRFVEGNHTLLAAQAKALELRVPLAVHHCLSSSAQAADVTLQQIEAELRHYGIPFMALIGAPEKVLPWAFGHLKPAAIFDDAADAASEASNLQLQHHPYPWPGRVMGLSEILALDPSVICSP